MLTLFLPRTMVIQILVVTEGVSALHFAEHLQYHGYYLSMKAELKVIMVI